MMGMISMPSRYVILSVRYSFLFLGFLVAFYTFMTVKGKCEILILTPFTDFIILKFKKCTRLYIYLFSIYLYNIFIIFLGTFFFAFWKKVVTYRQAAYHFSYCMFIHCFTDFITLPMSHSTKSLKKWKEWYIVYHWCLNVFVDLSFYMYKNESSL